MANYVGEFHQISAGGNFNETVPATAITNLNGIKCFAPSATGGSFTSFMDISLEVKTIIIQLADQASWNLYMVDSTSTIKTRIYYGVATDKSVVITDPIVLPPGYSITIESVGATQAMNALVICQPISLVKAE